ncbi:MAG: N-acetyltransferase [Anaerolineales bacterium]|nr:N-acetyltransferase [Anaerolineales bacterium]MCB9146195.1 N-acetyltransferase [Anaerolineales bacterium]
MNFEIDDSQIIHNETRSRFEISLDGSLAVLDYSIDGDSILMLHVGVPHEFRGRGVAALITKAALEYAKSKSLNVVPICSYVQAYLRRHPE